MSKNIIITGTSRGIGFELTRLFNNSGCKVLALSRNSEPLKHLNLEYVTAIDFDLSRMDDYDTVVDFVSAEWGKVDVLINNAGMLLNKPFAETSMADFQNVFLTNVFGVAELTRQILPFMNIHSHVVNISSMGGIQGSVKFPGLSAYSSSKGALITLTELLAEEYKDSGPSFNALALGAVQTEMLKEAFPDYNAPVTAIQMANYIFDFAINGNALYNGKVLQVSNSTP